MQEIADKTKFVDKCFLPCYNGIVKSKRLHKAGEIGARDLRLYRADTELQMKNE